jgi:N-acetylglucosaminyldiphosphoundecaprenol N-acetyl-beta-D-mannosaminyltransferase
VIAHTPVAPSLELTLRVRRGGARRSHPLWSWTQRLAALAVLTLLSPLLLVLYALVRLTSPGPFLFRQERPGLLGRPFVIYKIRTMSQGSERRTALGVSRTSAGITPVGRVLRDLKLDELPQLWNIVRGDMELVGPRPLPVALHEELARNIPHFDVRGDVKPGLSNVSQVSVADNGTDERLIADWSRRFEGELHYIRRKSFAYDATVIVMTLLFLLRRLLRRGRADAGAPVHGADGTEATLVLGSRIANLDYGGVTDRVARWIAEGSSRYVCICPVHSLVTARWSRSHRQALEAADLNTADGMPVVWAQRLLGHRTASRVYGPTLMIRALERAEREGWRVAFYGGRDDRNQVLIDRLRRRFPDLQIVAVISPPFRKLSSEESDDLIRQLRDAKPDLVWVGLGCPKQERWMLEHSPSLPAVMVGVGAAFDFHAGALRQAPAMLQRLGLEWAFRLAVEPRRLFKRYATTNPAYLMMLARQMLAAIVLRRNYQIRPSASPLASREAAASAMKTPHGALA